MAPGKRRKYSVESLFFFKHQKWAKYGLHYCISSTSLKKMVGGRSSVEPTELRPPAFYKKNCTWGLKSYFFMIQAPCPIAHTCFLFKKTVRKKIIQGNNYGLNLKKWAKFGLLRYFMISPNFDWRNLRWTPPLMWDRAYRPNTWISASKKQLLVLTQILNLFCSA